MIYLFNGERWEWKKKFDEGWYTSKEKYNDAHKEPDPDPVDAKEAERLESIRQGVSLVLEAGEPEDINVNGYPDVRAVEKIVGFDITPKERDRAYEEYREIGGVK